MEKVECRLEEMENEETMPNGIEDPDNLQQDQDLSEEETNVDIHKKNLLRMCRICGTNDLQHGSKTKDFFKHELNDLFQIDVDFDKSHIHPNALCRYHEKLLQRYAKAKREKTIFKTSASPVKFRAHTNDGTCTVCTPVIRRKRKRKGTKISCIKEFSCEKEASNDHKMHEIGSQFFTINSWKDNDSLHITTNLKESKMGETFTTAKDVLQMVKHLSEDEKSTFLSLLVNELSNVELSKLSYAIGKTQKSEILKDCESISQTYVNRERLLSLNPLNWLIERNQVLLNFVAGSVGVEADFINYIGKDDAFIFCRTVEHLYSLRSRKLVAPFSFLVSLDIYTKTSSRVAIDSLGKSSPGGTYNTLKRWLSSYGENEPVCPSGTLITAFDNEQVIGYKRGLGAGSKSLSSVITTVVNTQMQEKLTFVSSIQSNELLKPNNWFSTTSFDEKLKNTTLHEISRETQEKHKNDKDNFIKEVTKIRDSTLPDFIHLEKVHYEQVFYFLSKVIKDVLSEQEDQNGNITDYVDKQTYVEDREKDILRCATCGAENARRKLICDNCKQKDGIKKARQKQNLPNISKDGRNVTGSTEISLDITQDAISIENRYEHVSTNHTKKTKLAMGKPVFVNPNSGESVALVLRHIGINCGIKRYGGNERHWTFVCCDGRPHSLYQKLLNDCVICAICTQSFLTRSAYKEHHKNQHTNQSPSCSREFDWLYLRIGLGHYEMNIIKSFFELNWIPFLEKMCEILKFNSENAKYFAKTCKDHHVAWQLLLVFHTTGLKEMVVPFVRLMIQQKETPTPEKYLIFFKTVMSSNPRWAYLHVQVLRFSQAIINLRMGIRRNNSDLVRSAKFHLKELFYGRSHPHYQSIELFDTLQYHFMPTEVKQIWDENVSFTVSGNVSRGQDMDFLLEEKNRAVKQFIPSGSIPSEETWDSICCNLQYIEDLQKLVCSWIGKQKETTYMYQSKNIDIEDAVNAFRQTLRTYLKPENETFNALNGTKLHPGLLNFLEISTSKRMNFINTTVLNEEPNVMINQNEPVYVSEEEVNSHLNKLSKADIVRKIERLLDEGLEDSLLQAHYRNVLQSLDVGTMKKDTYLTMYYEIKDIIDSKCNIQDEESSDCDE